jgi:hypothetical protein
VGSLAPPHLGIVPPALVEVSISEEGQTWQHLGSATPAITPGKPYAPVPFTRKIEGQAARYVRAVVTPGKGWGVLSEVQVNGSPMP